MLYVLDLAINVRNIFGSNESKSQLIK